MSAWRPRRATRPRQHTGLLFAVVLGMSSGIPNALVLASSTVLHGVGLGLALGGRVGTVAFCSAVMTVFITKYTQYRSELMRAERQLLFTRSGRLAATSLGRAVFKDATVVAAVAGVSSFAGAALPLVIGALLPRATWMALVVAVAAMGGLGLLLSGYVGGRRSVWAVSLVIAGIAVTLVGVRMDLV